MQTMIYTLSPISDTKIRANAALKPDFAIASIKAVGPPLARVTATPTKVPRPTNAATPIMARRLAFSFSFGLQQREQHSLKKSNRATKWPHTHIAESSILLCAQWAKSHKACMTQQSYKSNSYGHCNSLNNRLSKFFGQMQCARPIHNVHVDHEFSLATDYWARDNPLKSLVTWFRGL